MYTCSPSRKLVNIYLMDGSLTEICENENGEKKRFLLNSEKPPYFINF